MILDLTDTLRIKTEQAHSTWVVQEKKTKTKWSSVSWHGSLESCLRSAANCIVCSIPDSASYDEIVNQIAAIHHLIEDKLLWWLKADAPMMDRRAAA